MIRENKNLIILSGALLVLLFSGAVILRKYVPFLFHSTVYYCQQLIDTFPLETSQLLASLITLGFVLLGLVVLVKFAFTIAKVLSFRRKLHEQLSTSKRIKFIQKRLNVTGKILILNDAKPVAFCFGIRNPKIYLSQGLLKLLNNQELEAVVRHEKHHLEQKDNLILLVLSVMTSLFPFFPVLKDIILHYRVNREKSADKAVVKGMQNADSIVSVLKKLILYEPNPAFVMTSNLAESDTLEERIKALVSKKSSRPKLSVQNMFISLLSVVAMYGLLLAPVYAVELHHDDQDVMMFCVQGRKCVSSCINSAIKELPMSHSTNSSTSFTPASFQN